MWSGWSSVPSPTGGGGDLCSQQCPKLVSQDLNWSNQMQSNSGFRTFAENTGPTMLVFYDSESWIIGFQEQLSTILKPWEKKKSLPDNAANSEDTEPCLKTQDRESRKKPIASSIVFYKCMKAIWGIIVFFKTKMCCYH